MGEYDRMAQMYIQQMTECHAVNLLEWRRRQHVLARQKNYAEAQRIKKIADKLEEKERKAMEQHSAALFARKEAQFRQQQQAELQALLKRIDARRKEHIKQRNLDSKRLLQRNRNVQAVLESKQAVESNRLFAEIKKNLYYSNLEVAPPMGASGGQKSSSTRKKKTRSRQADDEPLDGVDGGEEMPHFPSSAPDMTFLTSDEVEPPLE